MTKVQRCEFNRRKIYVKNVSSSVYLNVHYMLQLFE
jgi:hypothetical protein